MLLKAALTCLTCLGLAAAAPALTPAAGSASERVMIYGLLPAFLAKLAAEEARWQRHADAGLLPPPGAALRGMAPPWQARP